MTTIETGLKVTAFNSNCPMGAISFSETVLTGEIIKVNAKSFRVQFTESTFTKNREAPVTRSMKAVATFTFKKVLNSGKAQYAGVVNGSRFIIVL